MPFSHCEFRNCKPILKVETTDGRNFSLLESISYIALNGIEYIAPIGATTDGASTPPAIWSLMGKEFLPPFGDYWVATYFHDGAYEGWLLKKTDIGNIPAMLSKEESDSLLLEIMTHLDVEPLKRNTIYEGVNKAGKWSFDEDRKNLPTSSFSLSSYIPH